MGKQAKPKTGASRNDGRPSGKAAKQNPGRKVTGSKRTKLTEGQKILMGKGLYVKYANHDTAEARKMVSRRNRDAQSAD